MQHLEQEMKLDVGPEWSLPDLTGVLPGAKTVPMPTLVLEATYYDTPDKRLTDKHITLRYRRESHESKPRRPPAKVDHVWTLKLPSSVEGAALSRTEVNWELASAPRAKGGAPSPLPDVAEFVAGVTLGGPLRPIARVVTNRRRAQLRTSDGRVLAEIALDKVNGTNLAGGTPVDFSEVEVELAPGSAFEVLEAVQSRLVAAGAHPSARLSKLMTVMGQPGAPAAGPVARARRSGATMATVLQEQARACIDVLSEHDLPIRLGDPDTEHVHRSRVATRRLRSVARAFRSLAEPGADADDDMAAGWFAHLLDELSWLGRALGRARDTDVRLMSLEQACLELGPADAAGAATILGAAREELRQAHKDLLDAMSSERYRDCLRALDNLGRPEATEVEASVPGLAHLDGAVSGFRVDAIGPGVPVELWDRLSRPAAMGVPVLGRKQWRSLRNAVRRLGDEPSEEALHRVRIQAKRLRYLAEMARPVVRPASNRQAAERTAKAATSLQDILGGFHDASVHEAWLRQVVQAQPLSASRARQSAAIATAVAAGQLIAVARQGREEKRRAWPLAWERLDDPKLLRWAHGN